MVQYLFILQVKNYIKHSILEGELKPGDIRPFRERVNETVWFKQVHHSEGNQRAGI